METVSICTE